MAFFVLGSACGYTVGFRPRGGVRSVAVPIFENQSLRRELEFPLTEAVVREIQRRTPLVVTSPDRADVTLRGTIESFDQPVLVEGQRSAVLESSAVISLGVIATGRDGEVLFRYTGREAKPRPGVNGPALIEAAQFAEGAGASLAQPTNDAFAGLAERVVMLLEENMSRPPGASSVTGTAVPAPASGTAAPR